MVRSVVTITQWIELNKSNGMQGPCFSKYVHDTSATEVYFEHKSYL